MQIMQDAQAAVQANTRELEGMPFEHVLHEYLVFLRLKVFHALHYSVMLCFLKRSDVSILGWPNATAHQQIQ